MSQEKMDAVEKQYTSKLCKVLVAVKEKRMTKEEGLAQGKTIVDEMCAEFDKAREE